MSQGNYSCAECGMQSRCHTGPSRGVSRHFCLTGGGQCQHSCTAVTTGDAVRAPDSTHALAVCSTCASAADKHNVGSKH